MSFVLDKAPNPVECSTIEDLIPTEQKSYHVLEDLEVIFYIRNILELEYREVDLNLFIGIQLTNLIFFLHTTFMWRIGHFIS